MYQPVIMGYWRQHELWDGTYTVGDLLEILYHMKENMKRQRIEEDA